MGEFSGKVVVVTGGSRGIGRAIASAFARQGAQTVLAASSAANLAAAARTIVEAQEHDRLSGELGGQTGGPTPLTVAADLRELGGCEKVATAVREGFGCCDILVNSAGATRAGNFLDLPDAT